MEINFRICRKTAKSGKVCPHEISLIFLSTKINPPEIFGNVLF